MKISIVITCLIVLIACRKEYSVENIPKPTTATQLKFIKYTSNKPNYAELLEFRYDNNGRVSTLLAMEVDTVNGVAIIDTLNISNYLYQGLDSKPVKTIEFFGGGEATSFYTYDSQNRLLIDSTVINNGNPQVTVTLDKFSYQGNNVIVTYTNSSNPSNVWIHTLSFQNHNLTTILSTTNGNLYEKGAATFSTILNPLYTLNIHLVHSHIVGWGKNVSSSFTQEIAGMAAVVYQTINITDNEGKLIKQITYQSNNTGALSFTEYYYE